MGVRFLLAAMSIVTSLMTTFHELPMALKDEALTLVLQIYGALCSWEYDYTQRSDYTLIEVIDALVTDFVELRCKSHIIIANSIKEPNGGTDR